MKELTVYLATDQNLAPNASNGNYIELELVSDKKFSNHMKAMGKFEPKQVSPELSADASKMTIDKENLFNLIDNAPDDLKVVLLVTNDAGKSKITHDPKWNDYLICNINTQDIEKLVKQLTNRPGAKPSADTGETQDEPKENEKKLSEKFELTETEIEILRLICEEKTSEEIADKICLGRRTIEHYRSRILSKTNSRSPIGLVKFAIKNKLFVDL
ncbi:LuxR C-terminal-related transcriptional regulator [Fulvivirgaceae bacterium BMA12]|uniref:LuxR C-terminal-related transcriptional regulator n=1 Tax=Agaribacillus aureus TaxID=3051825 RepID=A0ABT8L4K8_9BACT|nr:LuxR C-terminal-related transcriptional regulator [Fulvivirgaceae bacterium BMA12]